MHPGERIALVGRNGSGKSTLMKMMAGQRRAGCRHALPAAGRWRSATWRRTRTSPASRRSAASPGRRCRRARTWRVAMAMEGLRLDPGLDPAQASGGERRRAALARILAEAPELMLLDEPTNHLDVSAIGWLEAHLARDPRRLRGGQPRPRLPARADRPHALGRPRRGAAARPGLRRLRGVARQDLRGGGRGPAQARPAAQGRGALGGRGHLGAAHAATRAGCAGCRSCGPSAARRSRARARRKLELGSAAPSGRLVIEAEGVAKAFGGRADRARLLDPDRPRRAGGAGRPERRRQDHAVRHPDRRARARQRPVRLGAKLAPAVFDQNRAALDPEASLWDTLTGGVARRSQRPGDGARPAAARRRLPQGVPVRRGAGARTGLGALRRRAGAAAAGAADGAALEPAGPRRADQRPRRRDARPARGARRRVRRHRAPGQPRPRLHRPRRHHDDRDGGRRPRRGLRRRLVGLPRPARRGRRAACRRRRAAARPKPAPRAGRAARGRG